MDRSENSATDVADVSLEVTQADALAERIFSLEEPWRSRFLELIAAHAEAPSSTDLCEAEVAGWLRNQRLYQQVRLMLRAWTHHT